MKELLRKASEKAILVIIVPAVLLVAVVLLPLVPFLLLYAYFSDKRFQKHYQQFLARMNGACFFCYNSRKSSVEFARDVVVPELAASVHVVFVDGNKVVAGVDSDYISKMLYSIKERKGFPYLLKIEAGRVLDLSVNNQFYSIMIGRKPIMPLVDIINLFFSTKGCVCSS